MRPGKIKVISTRTVIIIITARSIFRPRNLMRSNRRCPCRQCSYSPLLRIRNKPPRRAFVALAKTCGIVAVFEVRNCIGIENSSRFTVGERALKTLSDFNPHLSVARGQQQQYAGIIVLIAYAPFTRQSYRIAFNISAAEALNRDNYYLRLCLLYSSSPRA